MAYWERHYRGLVSSDWSECLSPNGPFDPISFVYPELEPVLSDIFTQYTGNRISLTQATSKIAQLLQKGLTEEQMDAYLDAFFLTYTNVPELIEWCLTHDVLFMINTTGTQGFFQRAIKKGLLPQIPVISANPLIHFPEPDKHEDRYAHHVLEIEDKATSTRAVMEACNLNPKQVIVIGDSGGDGPHFRWGAEHGALLVSSMTKHSLSSYCESMGISIHTRFGVSYAAGEKRDEAEEMKTNFMELSEIVAATMNR